MAEEDNIPSAFDDHPAIRNAYIRIFVGAAFDGMTREVVKLILAGYEIAFKASSSNINGLSDFAPLQRMALQAGKVAQWQKWRGPEDIPGVREPVTLKGYAAFSDLDKPMTDITDGWGWRAVQAGLQRRRNGKWEIKDVDVHELKLQDLSDYNVPGPHEPTQEQFNNVMNICVKHFQKLYNGIYLKVSGEPEPDLFHVQIGTDVSDLPASRKTSGLLAVTSKWFMCDHCDTPFFALVDRDAFDSTKINERDPWRYIKRNQSSEGSTMVSHGQSGQLASRSDEPVDLMHAIFLGIIKHLFREILQKNGMIDNEATKKPEDFLSRLIWPVSVSRMPPSIARGSGSIKADQWRSLITVLFVGLFFAWQVDGEIPNVDAPPSAENTKNAAAQRRQEKLVRSRMKENYLAKNPNPSEAELERIKTVQMNRSLRLHYENLVQFTAGIRIITSDTISPNEVKRGCGAVQRSIQSWADMNCHLVPYFHYAAVHLEPQFLKHGPAPGWWTFPYERNNGFLGRFNTNGHSGGELEGTMMRGWWKTTLILDLIARLEQIPHPTPEDVDSLNVLKSHLKAEKGERHGTLQNYITRAQADRNLGTKSLREMEDGLYHLVFRHLQTLWAPDILLIADVEMSHAKTAITFMGEVESFSHIWIHRRRYGAATQQRGIKAQYAYIDSRVPVRIHHIFRIQQNLPAKSKLTTGCAIVARFCPSTVITNFPWDLWATDIGVRAWDAEVFASCEVVSLERLSGQFVLAPVEVCEQALWITIAYDHEATEEDPEDEYEVE
ncbi:hypothetical protein DFH08DRAFT_978112 [Mycena albidolilacea]|uniref:Uncharacterized protein n=1 Tax=Mycena albidolilacea TaxID=1033008 RepID=A0AAD6YZC5_9AGAR|nr:hypothetical protein DFH08DRAFT_978112 [Mycena albidolilacea]